MTSKSITTALLLLLLTLFSHDGSCNIPPAFSKICFLKESPNAYRRSSLLLLLLRSDHEKIGSKTPATAAVEAAATPNKSDVLMTFSKEHDNRNESWRRRSMISSSFGAVTGSALSTTKSWKDDEYRTKVAALTKEPFLVPAASATVGSWPNNMSLRTNLGRSRLLASELSPLTPSLVPFAADNEVYYPDAFFGAWNVTATLRRKIYPYGTQYLPSKQSPTEGSPRNRMESIGDSTSTELHYYSTLANTFNNNAIVSLGLGVPKSRIISDRAYNAKSMSAAYKQLARVEDVQWDPREDPTRMTLNEQYVDDNDEGGDDDDDKLAFCAAERTRLVTLSPGNVLVSDMESITEFQSLSLNGPTKQIIGACRLAIYLTPNPNSREGVLWQQINGKAVAFFDYDIHMVQLLEKFTDSSDGTSIERPCVRTPKDYIQCY